MDVAHLAEYFKQDKFADVELAIVVPAVTEDPVEDITEPPAKRARLAATDGKVLARFPAHRVVLVGTDYFKAQVQGTWAPAVVDEAAAADCSRPQWQLTIDSAEQLPAAEAVVAALYCNPTAFNALEHAQLVTAAVLADRIGATSAASQAVQVLKAAFEAKQLQPAATFEALASLTAWPTCLQPVLLSVLQYPASAFYDVALDADAASTTAHVSIMVQRMLLAVLGDLEAVWRDEQLQHLLQQLSLTAMQLLLGSHYLRVASEDTVLYTASKYMQNRTSEVEKAAVSAALAPLVCAPHLSGWVLSGQALSSSSSDMLLQEHNEQLKQLISHKLATGGAPYPVKTLSYIIGAPPAWRLGPRQVVPLEPVQLTWKLPVAMVVQACRESFVGNDVVRVLCPISSPVMGGTPCTLWIDCAQNEEDGVRGTLVGLYAVPKDASLMFGSNVFVLFQCTLACSSCGIERMQSCTGMDRANHDNGSGYYDFFELGVMSEGGGWDEAAWAAKGLPTSGEVELSLHMHSVGGK